MCEPFESYCGKHDINYEFSAPRSPQQNVVIERKNKTLQEMARTILSENNLPKYFWAKAVNTASNIVNGTNIWSILKKTSNELWKDRLPNISYFHAFGCTCYVHKNGKEVLEKFDDKSNEGHFPWLFNHKQSL